MVAASVPQMPVPDRPLNALDLVDGAFAIMRARPRTVAGIVATFTLPTQLLAAWLQRDVLSDFSFNDFDDDSGPFGPGSDGGGFGFFQGSPAALVFSYLVLPFIGVALTHLVTGWRQGVDRDLQECLLFTLKRAHLILAAWILAKCVQLLTLLIATPVLILVAPILAVERLGPIAAVRRAISLGRRRYGGLFSLLLLVVLVNVLLSTALATVPLVVSVALGDWGWIAFFAIGSVSTAVLNLLGVGVAVLAYVDMTNRTEADDLRRRLEAVQAGGV